MSPMLMFLQVRSSKDEAKYLYQVILCVSLRRLVPVVAAVTIGVFYVCLCGDWSR